MKILRASSVLLIAPLLSGCLGAAMAADVGLRVVVAAVDAASKSNYASSSPSSTSPSAPATTPNTGYCIDDKLDVSYVRVNAECMKGDRLTTKVEFDQHQQKQRNPRPAALAQAATPPPTSRLIYCHDSKVNLAYTSYRCVRGDTEVSVAQYEQIRRQPMIPRVASNGEQASAQATPSPGKVIYCHDPRISLAYAASRCGEGDKEVSLAEFERLKDPNRPGTPPAKEGSNPPSAVAAAPAPPSKPGPPAALPSTPSPPPRDLVSRIQTLLNAVGYDVGKPDGAVGTKTREAIRDFQARAKVEVTGEPSEALLGQLQIVVAAVRDTKKPEPAKLVLSSTGTGIIIGTDGKILTNHHVIDECRELRVRHQDISESKAALLAADARNDLALISVRASGLSAAKFRTGQFVRQGEDVVAYGFPLRGVLASGAGMTTGIVSALAGMGDDSRRLQITAPVQPGNSGGPLLDQSGSVVGVIDSKLNAIKVARVTGDIPQNINFAIKGPVAQTFLDSTQATYVTTVDTAKIATVDIADKARKFTVLVECWK